MKKLWILVVLVLVLLPSTVSAMTWEEFVEEYGAMPPPPPDASNTDVWVDPFQSGDYSDGGDTPAEMDAKAFVVDWEGQDVWLWT